ncbi:hypothetical protein HDU82_008717 [Entophlyctis luteolus]|nr:hypothetical protein HDU82_008717 [Entophlyctis luteolus]
MSLQTGMDLMAQAAKCMDKKSFFGKPNPDIDAARPLFEQAALQFRNCKAYDSAVDALLKAADCYKAQDAFYLSAKQIETAAVMLQTQAKKPAESAAIFKQAANMYTVHGSPDKSAECYEKAARGLETINPSEAEEYYSEACSIYDSEDKQRNSIDTRGRFISFLVKNKRWNQAAQQSEQVVAIWKKLENRMFFNKQALATIIIVLSQGDSVEARKKLLAFEDEEGEISQHLIEAFENYDDELLSNVLKRQTIKYLDNEIAKAAINLRIPGSGNPSTQQGSSQAPSSGYNLQQTGFPQQYAPQQFPNLPLNPSRPVTSPANTAGFSATPSRNPTPPQTASPPSTRPAYAPRDPTPQSASNPTVAAVPTGYGMPPGYKPRNPTPASGFPGVVQSGGSGGFEAFSGQITQDFRPEPRQQFPSGADDDDLC